MGMAMGEEKKGSLTYYVRGAILGLALVVFLGNMMMWVIMPTFTYYLKWLPQLLAHTHSTFFDIQGTIMLNFTFPILFIALIGCFYIHLGKGATNPNINLQRNDWLKALRKPKIIKPVGIVTWIELSFAAMFVVLCVWYFAAYLHYHYTSISAYAAAKGVPVWQAKIDRVALVAGLTGNICLTFLFYPVTRKSSILPMLGLTSEGSIKYHIWLGHAAMLLFTTHGLLYILFWAVSHRLHEMANWDPHYISNVAGEISLLMGLMMWATTFTPIRRKMFELFFYTHYLYIGFILFFTLHTGFFYACIMLPGFYLFLLDRYLRFLQSRQNVTLLSARLLPPCQTFELVFSKAPGLKYNPTSIMFINVPTISKLQWHPFTITSNCNMEEDTMSAIVKCEGSWTKKLFDLISSPSPLDSLQVSVEGPYGPAQTHFLRHDVLVMISGGSGITPFISIIKEVIISSSQNQKTPKLILIPIFKNSSHLSTLDLLLPLTPPAIPNHLDIQIEAYITRETKPTTPEKPEPVRTVRFKPSASDAPISPVLGRHGWLWLAAIIAASFLVYLLLVGVLYQYYVYPKDHGTNQVFPYHTRALLNLLFMCFGIGASASAAFLWNKKKILETGDSSSLGCGHDDHQELESFPAQSLRKLINTHYCTRPDLKRILMGIKGSSVGVLASGPKTLRHDVAAICSSGPLSNNVTFESISFNW